MDEQLVAKRREIEKDVMLEMVEIYCRGNHKDVNRQGKRLCPECMKFYEYTCVRTDKCPFMETKTFCNQCPVHCYNKTYRPVVKEVMKYSGPRLCLHHPVPVALHMVTTVAAKEKLIHDAKKQGISIEELKEQNKKAALQQMAAARKKS